MKVLYLVPHLSTGGMPSFVLKTIELLKYDVKIYVVEYNCHSLEYTVQRDKIKKIVGNNFYSLGENKEQLLEIIKECKPNIVHIHEPAERFDHNIMKKLYKNRTYCIIETCHDISFEPNTKIFNPDYYAFCTPYHLTTFKDTISPKDVIEFPIDNFRASEEDSYVAKQALKMDTDRKHVVNIGLWTPGKNQKEMIELAREMPEIDFHFVGNQAINFKEYWEPLMKDTPENVKIWGERKDTKYFLMAADVFMFNSVWECNPLVIREAISMGKKIITRNLPQYGNMFSRYITNLNSTKLKNQLNDLLIDHTKYDILNNNTSSIFKEKMLSLYKKVNIMENSYKITQHFVGQPFLEITGISDSIFDVEFYDFETKELIYSNKIKCNNWIRLNREYFTKWQTIVYKDGVEVYNNVLDYTNKKVYIAFDSSSLGDTIAWIPYVEEFRKKHNCHVIVSTFKNFLFESEYPELKFVTPGTIVENIYGMYKLGWFYDTNKEPALPNTISLQAAASNILGLKYEEIKPKIKSFKSTSPKYKLVTIATNSTAECKHWTREGWQKVINYLANKGYKVKNVSYEDNPFDNCESLIDKSLESTIDWIEQSEFFIGLSSGLSWLAWGLGKEVVMISNFSEDWHEFLCYRITNTKVCHGCWNNVNFKFDKADWNWCPIWKGYDKQFECQKSITANSVIDTIKKLLK